MKSLFRFIILGTLIIGFGNFNESSSYLVAQKKKVLETSADVKKKQEATQKEIKQTQEQIEKNEKSVKNGLKELGKLEWEINESKKKIGVITGQINILNSKISQLEKSIDSDEKELNLLRDEYLKVVKKMRIARKNNSELAFIFSSGNFNQALRRMRYLKEFSEWKDRQTNAITEKIERLQEEKRGLAKTKDQQSLALQQQKNEQAKLENQYSRQDVLVAGLKKNGEALHAHLSKKQAEANDLKNRIAALIAEEQRKAAEEKARQEAARKAEEERLAREEQARREAEETQKEPQGKSKAHEETSATYADARKRKPRSKDSNSSSNNTSSSTASTGVSVSNENGFASMKGRLPSPASGYLKVTSRFGQQSLPDLPDVMYDNPGIDAEVPAGASAVSVYDGKVSGVYMLPGYNTVIIVNHGNYYTVYGNISSASVKVGDEVKIGQGLGKIAADDDDPSHGSLHFEVWKNRDKLNPLEWIKN